MSEENTPITIEQFEDVLNSMKLHMDADNWHKAQVALSTLKQRGLPDPSTYSTTSVTADDEEDLNLKMHLIMMPGLLKFKAGEASLEDAVAEVMPLLNEMAHWAMNFAWGGTPDWPVTISVETEENDED